MNGCRVLVVVAAAALLMLVLPMTAAGVETTKVTIGVNEYIVLNNDIHIGLIDVDADMVPHAKVRFYGYLDPDGKTATLYMGDCPVKYTSGTGLTIEVTLDSVSSNGASFVIESSKKLIITDRYNFEVPTLTPSGLAVLVGLLSLIAISMIKRRNQG